MSEATKYAVEMRGVTKRFGEVVANRNINLKVQDKSIHAIIGENGAGKSTAMNILYGFYNPDEGEILVDGQPLLFDGGRRAVRMDGLKPAIVDAASPGAGLPVHDETADPAWAFLLSRLVPPDFPTPIGVFRAIETETYDGAMNRQLREATARLGAGDVGQLLGEGETWDVPEPGPDGRR